MKEITKDNKGITLIALIITIILMLILVSVTTYTGLNTYKRTQVTKFVTQMQLLQAKIDDLVETQTSEELNALGLQTVTTDDQKDSINSAFNNQEVTSNDINEYKVFTKDDVLNLLDVEDIQDDIMVNFATREIVSLSGIEYGGTTYYTQYKLPNGQTIINGRANERKLNFAMDLSIDGINSTVTIREKQDDEKEENEEDTEFITNGTLSYKEQSDDYWQIVTNYTESSKSYDISISKSGNYTFKLQDNTDSENYIEETIVLTLTNKPKTTLSLEPYNYGEDSDTWAYAQKDGVYYVWIPRFAYKTNTETNSIEIKFIKGNSNVATDNTYIDNTWNIHNKFTTSDGTEITGIWVSVGNTVNQTGLNMIDDLLNDSTRTILIEI